MNRFFCLVILLLSSTQALAACPRQSSLSGKKYSSYIEVYSGGNRLVDICLLRGQFNSDGTEFSGSGYCTTTPVGVASFSVATRLETADYNVRECIARVAGTTSTSGGQVVAFTGTTALSLNGKAFDTVSFASQTGFHYVERGVLQ